MSNKLFTLKAISMVVVFFFSVQAYGQKSIVWFDIGLKAQYGATGFYNSAIGNSNAYDYKIPTGYGIGGKLGINFGYSGIAIDVMRSTASQTFDITGTGGIGTVNWNATDIYVLFRNAKNLGYFEIGPKISFVKKVEDDLEGGTLTDRTSDYNKTNFSGVIGFGANIMGNDGRFSGILGLRFEYGVTDFVSPGGEVNNAPLRNAAVYTDGYKKSNVAFAGVVFEVNWGVGYVGKAQCGARSKFIMF